MPKKYSPTKNNVILWGTKICSSKFVFWTQGGDYWQTKWQDDYILKSTKYEWLDFMTWTYSAPNKCGLTYTYKYFPFVISQWQHAMYQLQESGLVAFF